MLYVIIQNLSTGQKKGQVTRLNLKCIDKLIESGAISEYYAPPWEQIPGFRFRRKLFDRTVEAFLYGDNNDLNLPDKLIERWKSELVEQLFGIVTEEKAETTPKKKGG